MLCLVSGYIEMPGHLFCAPTWFLGLKASLLLRLKLLTDFSLIFTELTKRLQPRSFDQWTCCHVMMCTWLPCNFTTFYFYHYREICQGLPLSAQCLSHWACEACFWAYLLCKSQEEFYLSQCSTGESGGRPKSHCGRLDLPGFMVFPLLSDSFLSAACLLCLWPTLCWWFVNVDDKIIFKHVLSISFLPVSILY